jgi:hypothetical protein
MRIPFLIAASAALLSSLPANAGDTYFVLGGGANLAEFNRDLPSGAPEFDQGFRFGPCFHLGFQAPGPGDNASVLSLGYESRGAVWTAQDANGRDVDVTIKFNYLQLGYQYKFLFGGSHQAAGYFAPGLGASILIHSTAEAPGEEQDMDGVNSIDLEASLALGVQAPVGLNHAFFLEGGYGYGLFDTDTDREDASANNSVIKLRAGFLIGL